MSTPEIKMFKLVSGMTVSRTVISNSLISVYRLMAPRAITDQEFGELARANAFDNKLVSLFKETKLIHEGMVYYRYFFEETT